MTQTIIHYIENDILEGQSGINITPDEDLLSSGLIDSMNMMKLIGFIEEHFQTKIPPEDLVIEHFMTVGDMERYLKGNGVVS